MCIQNGRNILFFALFFFYSHRSRFMAKSYNHIIFKRQEKALGNYFIHYHIQAYCGTHELYDILRR